MMFKNLIWSLSVLGFYALFAVSGCRPTSRASYQFESHPRTVLAAMGVQHSGDPKLAVSSSGTVYMLAVYGQGEPARLGLAISHDGADTFMPIVPISQPDASVSSHGENSPSLATTPTRIHALWEQPTNAGAVELMAARSANFGHSFEKPVRVTDKAQPSFNGFSSLGVAPTGDVYAVWLDARDRTQAEETFSVYIAKSTDQGASFGKNIRVALGACPCCRPSMAFGKNGEVFVAWRRVFPGDIRDVVVSTSRDGGQTFGSPVRVATDNWKLSGCPHSGPAIVEHNGRIYAAWLTEGTERKATIRLAWSDDAANIFNPAVSVSGSVLDPNHPVLGRSEDGTVLLVFQGRDALKSDGWSPIRSYLVEIRGTRASHVEAVPGNQASISYPVLGVGTAGRVYVAWTEKGDQGGSVVLCRGRSG